MKKIIQDKLEVFTSKADAIDKLTQMQGSCREEMNSRPIVFYCSKKGNITISNPPSRHPERDSSTNLYGKVIEENNKTYISFYTCYSKANTVSKIISYIFLIVITIVAIMFINKTPYKAAYLLVLLLGIAYYIVSLISATKEGKNSSEDSDKLVNELKNRIEAINNWDK